MNSTRRRDIRRNLDWVTIGLYALLVIIGWTAIYSANFSSEHPNVFDFKVHHHRTGLIEYRGGILHTLLGYQLLSSTGASGASTTDRKESWGSPILVRGRVLRYTTE